MIFLKYDILKRNYFFPSKIILFEFIKANDLMGLPRVFIITHNVF